jgi:uncharacterized protein YbjT (DUF2867 family)
MRQFTRLSAALLLALMAIVNPAAAADPGKGTVFYAGATGSIGRIAVGLLREQGYSVRGLTRNPARAERLYGDDVEWVRGDVREPTQMTELMRGADVVVCSISYTEFEGPNSPQFVDYMGVRNLVDAAKANGVRQLVLVSAGSAGPWRDHTRNPRFGYVAYWKTKGEDYLKQSGVPFTIIGPTGFVDGAGDELGIRLTSRAEYGMGMIRRADVAAVTIGAIGNPGALGKAVFIENSAELSPNTWRDEFANVAPE